MFSFFFTASSTRCTIHLSPTHSHLVQTLSLFLKRLVWTHSCCCCCLHHLVRRRRCAVSMSVFSHLCNVLIFFFLVLLMALVSRFSWYHKESFEENTELGAHTRSQSRTHRNHSNEPALHWTVSVASCYSASWFFSAQKNLQKTNENLKRKCRSCSRRDIQHSIEKWKCAFVWVQLLHGWRKWCSAETSLPWKLSEVNRHYLKAFSF